MTRRESLQNAGWDLRDPPASSTDQPPSQKMEQNGTAQEGRDGRPATSAGSLDVGEGTPEDKPAPPAGESDTPKRTRAPRHRTNQNPNSARPDYKSSKAQKDIHGTAASLLATCPPATATNLTARHPKITQAAAARIRSLRKRRTKSQKPRKHRRPLSHPEAQTSPPQKPQTPTRNQQRQIRPIPQRSQRMGPGTGAAAPGHGRQA